MQRLVDLLKGTDCKVHFRVGSEVQIPQKVNIRSTLQQQIGPHTDSKHSDRPSDSFNASKWRAALRGRP
eukprot:4845685-Amphidinium_carterae.1